MIASVERGLRPESWPGDLPRVAVIISAGTTHVNDDEGERRPRSPIAALWGTGAGAQDRIM